MREIKNAHDLAKVWSDGSLINEKVLDDPAVLKKLEEIFKISDFFVEDREGAYAYAKKWKFSSLVKIESTFNDSEEK